MTDRAALIREFHRLNRALARRGMEQYPADPNRLADADLASVISIMELEYRTLLQAQAEESDRRRPSHPEEQK